MGDRMHVLRTFSERPLEAAKAVEKAVEHALHIEKHRPMSGLDAKNGRTPPPVEGEHHDTPVAAPAPEPAPEPAPAAEVPAAPAAEVPAAPAAEVPAAPAA